MCKILTALQTRLSNFISVLREFCKATATSNFALTSVLCSCVPLLESMARLKEECFSLRTTITHLSNFSSLCGVLWWCWDADQCGDREYSRSRQISRNDFLVSWNTLIFLVRKPNPCLLTPCTVCLSLECYHYENMVWHGWEPTNYWQWWKLVFFSTDRVRVCSLIPLCLHSRELQN